LNPSGLARADVGQVAPLRAAGGVFIEVDRDAQFITDASADLAGELRAVLHRDTCDRDERAHVHRPEPRMFTAMPGHVDQFGGLPRAAKSRFSDGRRITDEGYNGAVGALAGIDVEQSNPPHGADGVGDLPNDVGVTALGEIRHAFDDLLHTGYRARSSADRAAHVLSAA
jgi:hypothetical protein